MIVYIVVKFVQNEVYVTCEGLLIPGKTVKESPVFRAFLCVSLGFFSATRQIQQNLRAKELKSS